MISRRSFLTSVGLSTTVVGVAKPQLQLAADAHPSQVSYSRVIECFCNEINHDLSPMPNDYRVRFSTGLGPEYSGNALSIENEAEIARMLGWVVVKEFIPSVVKSGDFRDELYELNFVANLESAYKIIFEIYRKSNFPSEDCVLPERMEPIHYCSHHALNCLRSSISLDKKYDWMRSIAYSSSNVLGTMFHHEYFDHDMFNGGDENIH